MEPFALAVLIVFALAVALLYFQDAGGAVRKAWDERHSYSFDPATNSNVTRKFTVIAPPQLINGEQYDVIVEALPFPAEPYPSIIPDEREKPLLTRVAILRVRTKAGSRVLSDFDPPLSVRIEYSDDDARKAALAGGNGTQRLSVVALGPDQAGAGSAGKWAVLEPEDDGASQGVQRIARGRLRSLAPPGAVGLGGA